MNIIKKYLEKLMKKACHRTIKDCDKRLIKKPFDIEIWLKKGSALDGLARYKEALECYNRALEIAPKNTDLWFFKGGSLMAMEKYGEAIICYNKVLELDPDYTEVEDFRKKALKALKEQDNDRD